MSPGEDVVACSSLPSAPFNPKSAGIMAAHSTRRERATPAVEPNQRLRGDLRYFRAFPDENKDENEPDGIRLTDYGFLRVSVGVTFGFGR